MGRRAQRQRRLAELANVRATMISLCSVCGHNDRVQIPTRELVDVPVIPDPDGIAVICRSCGESAYLVIGFA